MKARENPPDSEIPSAGKAGDKSEPADPTLLPALKVSADPKNGDDRLRAVTARLALALEVGNIGVWEWDFAMNQVVWDERMYAIYGIPVGTSITSDLWKQVVHPDDLGEAGGIFAPVVQFGLREKHRFRILHPGGGIRYVEAAEELVLGAGGAPIACVGIHQDVTEWWEMREAMLARQNALEKESLTDPLTGVGNRRNLDQSLANEVSRVRRYGGKLSFLIADMDDFKAINDVLGHDAGDAALRSVAAVMASSVRATDIVARFGGDEFCIVLPATGSAAAGALAERIRHRLEQAPFGRPRRRLTASFGIVQYRDGETVENMLQRADQALYDAKALGKNRAVSNLGDSVRSAVEEFSREKECAQTTAVRKPVLKTMRCAHCFLELGYVASASQRAELERSHHCAEGLLAKQAAAAVPYN